MAIGFVITNMKKLLALLLLFGIVGCEISPDIAYEEKYSKYKPFAAVSIAPGMSLNLNPNCSDMGGGCEFDKRFYCELKDSIDDAKACAISECQKFYDVKNSPNWISQDNLSCLTYDLGEGSYISENPYFYARLRLNNSDTPDVREYKQALQKNNKNYLNTVERTKIKKRADSIRRAEAQREKEKRKAEQLARAEKKKIEQQQAQYQSYVDGKKRLCTSYGFVGENAIAKCVQTEISNEITRLQNQIAQAQANANAQARANTQSRSRAMSNYSRCLSTAGETFGSCANAWNGYTPKPAKKVYRCDYDVFGNQISSTCREQ